MAKPLDWKSHWSAVRERALIPAGARVRGGYAWIQNNDPVYRALRSPGRAEIWAASVALLLVVATVVFLLLFDWNWLRGPIGRWASTTYDREIELNGDLDVNLFSWTPSARVRDLRIGGPDWALARDTVQVEDLLVMVQMRRLFVGQIEMPLLSIIRPNVVLIADKEGRTSWTLHPDRPDDGQGMKLPPIHRLIITDGKLSLDEQRRNVKLEATVSAREGSDEQAGFHLQGDGTINGTPLTLTVRGGPFINIRRDHPYDFIAELSGVNSRLKADGAITRPFDLGQFNATLSLEGRDMADLYLLTGITLPNTPRYRLSGALSRDDALFRFKDFSGRVGSSDLSGDIKVDKVGDRRRVEAMLHSQSLDIADLMTVLGAQPQVSAGGTTVTSGTPGRLLPDAPLQTSRLRAMDGTLSYRAASVKRNDLEIRRVRLDAGLDGGVLKLDPVAFTFSRGELNGTARIDARKDVPYSTVDFRLSGYPLESIIPARNGAPTVTGLALGRARLEGPGASVHDLAANAKGTVSLVVPQGQIRKAFAELLGINVGRGLSLLLSGDRSTTDIRCAVADFDVVGGTATAKTFVIDTDVVLAKGTGTINLGSETMNLRIDGETKQPRLLRVWAPITVRGPLVAPKLGVDGAAVAGQVGLAGVIAALVNPLAAILPFIDPGLAEDANCGALVAGAR
ncbi:AsmA family protein [uncultured Brevundimonas sp.]|uniref:AsmA family protein n=1 Tax=uncultured Brevundimonas sp. TaxID=213418 RepID=UPI0030EF111E